MKINKKIFQSFLGLLLLLGLIGLLFAQTPPSSVFNSDYDEKINFLLDPAYLARLSFANSQDKASFIEYLGKPVMGGDSKDYLKINQERKQALDIFAKDLEKDFLDGLRAKPALMDPDANGKLSPAYLAYSNKLSELNVKAANSALLYINDRDNSQINAKLFEYSGLKDNTLASSDYPEYTQIVFGNDGKIKSISLEERGITVINDEPVTIDLESLRNSKVSASIENEGVISFENGEAAINSGEITEISKVSATDFTVKGTNLNGKLAPMSKDMKVTISSTGGELIVAQKVSGAGATVNDKELKVLPDASGSYEIQYDTSAGGEASTKIFAKDDKSISLVDLSQEGIISTGETLSFSKIQGADSSKNQGSIEIGNDGMITVNSMTKFNPKTYGESAGEFEIKTPNAVAKYVDYSFSSEALDPSKFSAPDNGFLIMAKTEGIFNSREINILGKGNIQGIIYKPSIETDAGVTLDLTQASDQKEMTVLGLNGELSFIGKNGPMGADGIDPEKVFYRSLYQESTGDSIEKFTGYFINARNNEKVKQELSVSSSIFSSTSIKMKINDGATGKIFWNNKLPTQAFTTTPAFEPASSAVQGQANIPDTGNVAPNLSPFNLKKYAWILDPQLEAISDFKVGNDGRNVYGRIVNTFGENNYVALDYNTQGELITRPAQNINDRSYGEFNNVVDRETGAVSEVPDEPKILEAYVRTYNEAGLAIVNIKNLLNLKTFFNMDNSLPLSNAKTYLEAIRMNELRVNPAIGGIGPSGLYGLGKDGKYYFYSYRDHSWSPAGNINAETFSKFNYYRTLE